MTRRTLNLLLVVKGRFGRGSVTTAKGDTVVVGKLL